MAVTTYKPTINVPFAMRIKWVDVFPNDPAKNYGPSLALRGDINGEDCRVYPKGFLDANLGAMVNAGIIEAPSVGDFDYEPAEKYSIPVVQGAVTITLSQPAGEKYAKTVFLTATGKPPVSAPAAVSRPRTIGTLPGDEPGYLEAVANEGSAAPNFATTGREPGPDYTAQVRTSKLQQVEQQYACALTWVLDNVVPKLTRADIPLDMSGINAAVATLLIGSKS